MLKQGHAAKRDADGSLSGERSGAASLASSFNASSESVRLAAQPSTLSRSAGVQLTQSVPAAVTTHVERLLKARMLQMPVPLSVHVMWFSTCNNDVNGP